MESYENNQEPILLPEILQDIFAKMRNSYDLFGPGVMDDVRAIVATATISKRFKLDLAALLASRAVTRVRIHTGDDWHPLPLIWSRLIFTDRLTFLEISPFGSKDGKIESSRWSGGDRRSNNCSIGGPIVSFTFGQHSCSYAFEENSKGVCYAYYSQVRGRLVYVYERDPTGDDSEDGTVADPGFILFASRFLDLAFPQEESPAVSFMIPITKIVDPNQ